MIDRLALFGATGDLAGRYLLPALAALQAAGELPDGFRLTAAAIEDWDDDAFRRHADERLREHAPAVAEDARHALVRSSRYRQIDFADAAGVAAVIGGADARPLVTYLALPPAVFPAAVTAIGKADLPAGSRIALEKPFGEDLASAVALNRLLAKVVADAGEQAVFRVDHFLGLATVQNLLGLRLANRVFDAAWNSLHIERVEIVWDETLTLEGRGYYDASGALRDLIQNHLLHVFCLVALESPPTLNERELRDRKLDILRSVRPPTAAEMSRRTRRGRYGAGRIGERSIPAYVDEEGVDPQRRTETFAEIVLEIASERWRGTPFVLRTAKAMARDRREVVVRFRPVRHLPFSAAAGDAAPNELRIGLAEPGYLTLRLTGNSAGPPLDLVPLELGAQLPPTALPEYGRVLRDILGGGSMLSVRGDEAEQAWRIVTPVLEAWAQDRVPLQEYAAGSDGPSR